MRTRYRSAVLVEKTHTTVEGGLWAAVIGQAFSDALCSGCEGSSTHPDDVRRARNWLLFDRKDFHRVCEFAGIVPSAVRRKALELAGSNWTDQVVA